MIKKILKFFAPNSYLESPYIWLLNQFGHCTISALITYYLCLIWGYLFIPVIVFWLFWEFYHLVMTKDFKDFKQDLTFEIGGVFVGLYFEVFTPIMIGVLAYLFYKNFCYDKS